jgi:hypothetical protein
MGLALLVVPVQTQRESPSPSTTNSKATMSPGQRVIVASEGAPPGAVVTITLDRSSSIGSTADRPTATSPAPATLIVGRAVAAEDGSFRRLVAIPPETEPGVYALISATDSRQLARTAVRVGRSGATAAPSLSLSGTEVLPGVLAGAGLIVAGGLFLLAVPYKRCRIT